MPLPTYATSVGMPLSTAWTHVQAGKIDAVKVGKRWFVPHRAGIQVSADTLVSP